MKYHAIWLCSLLVLGPVWVQAQVLTDDDALAMAEEQLRTELLAVAESTEDYCIVQRLSGTGFVIIDKRPDMRRRVIGWSADGRWVPDELPPALPEWLADRMERHIHPVLPVATAREDERDDDSRFMDREDVQPLLTCHWHQSSPYNDLCPVIADGNVKTAAGCVAIAAAQVAYYWREWLPEKTLRDTPTYPYGAAPVTESVAAGTPNHWELLLDDYEDADDEAARVAAAQLAYVIGTSSYLQYAASTGGQITDAATALYVQFRMKSELAVKANYEQVEWERLIYEDLREGCPIIYSGNRRGDGHAVVIDGYDSSLDLFHFNFGWGGSGDGYYTVDDETGMNGYNQGQQCVCRIVPHDYLTTVRMPVPDDRGRGVYDLNGRRIPDGSSGVTDRLQKGIYIVNGKKMIIHE